MQKYSFDNVHLNNKIYSKYCIAYIHHNCSIKTHTHDFYEINIILKGSGTHFIEKNNLPVAESDFFVIPPLINHGYESTNLEVFHLLLSELFLNKYRNDLEEISGFVNLFKIEPELRSNTLKKTFFKLNNEQMAEINEIINNFYKFSEYQNFNCDLLNCSLAIQLITLLCNYFSIPNKQKQLKESELMFFKCLQEINMHLSETISINKLAKEYFMSTNSFINKFKNFTGYTPADYIMNCRLEKAKDLLLETEKQITEIAQDCNFFDNSHFTRFFRKKYGMTPKEYRKSKAKTMKELN